MLGNVLNRFAAALKGSMVQIIQLVKLVLGEQKQHGHNALFELEQEQTESSQNKSKKQLHWEFSWFVSQHCCSNCGNA